MPAVHVGTAIAQDIEIYNTDGVLADPDTLTVTLRAPDGTQTDYVYGVDPEITRTSAGLYTFDTPALSQVTSKQRLYWVAWIGTGSGITVTDEASQEVCALHVALTPP